MPEDLLEIVRDGRQLAVAGELDMTTARTLTAAVDVLLQEAQQPITVEASAILFCDSAGIRCLLDALKQVEVIILNPHPRLLALLGLVAGFAPCRQAGGQYRPRPAVFPSSSTAERGRGADDRTAASPHSGEVLTRVLGCDAERLAALRRDPPSGPQISPSGQIFVQVRRVLPM